MVCRAVIGGTAAADAVDVASSGFQVGASGRGKVFHKVSSNSSRGIRLVGVVEIMEPLAILVRIGEEFSGEVFRKSFAASDVDEDSDVLPEGSIAFCWSIWVRIRNPIPVAVRYSSGASSANRCRGFSSCGG